MKNLKIVGVMAIMLFYGALITMQSQANAFIISEAQKIGDAENEALDGDTKSIIDWATDITSWYNDIKTHN